VWRWDQQEPFGVSVADENPSGLGTFQFPLRFAGQYLDKETNLHYNYFRDYDPSIGRYVEGDPIPHAFGERPMLKLMYAALIRAAQTWKRIVITGVRTQAARAASQPPE
jgi:RHS repeat-associated protein